MSRPSRRVLIIVAAGCAVGIAMGVANRWSSDQALFPGALRWFALVAGSIGAAEELAYRGYIQGRVRSLGAFPAVVMAALCHTAYKCALFLLPAPPVEIDLCFLATSTLLAGLVAGALRELGRSAIPAIAAHVCFDIVVYGGLERAPWWVWGA
ncbi:MAG: CPBP family glutamic-type intramembrane protease [Planctomycetota bacterium]|jgi:membrane protease YdiL (CAAX protease family)